MDANLSVTIPLTATAAEWNIIGDAIANGPYRVVGPLIDTIRMHFMELNAKEAAAANVGRGTAENPAVVMGEAPPLPADVTAAEAPRAQTDNIIPAADYSPKPALRPRRRK